MEVALARFGRQEVIWVLRSRFPNFTYLRVNPSDRNWNRPTASAGRGLATLFVHGLSVLPPAPGVANERPILRPEETGHYPILHRWHAGQVGQVRVLVHQQSSDQRFIMAISAQVFL